MRVMPNTPCLVGETASAMCLGGTANEEDAEEVRTLFSSVGRIVQVSHTPLCKMLVNPSQGYMTAWDNSMHSVGQKTAMVSVMQHGPHQPPMSVVGPSVVGGTGRWPVPKAAAPRTTHASVML